MKDYQWPLKAKLQRVCN